MEARTSLGTLHATITGKKVAAHAEGKAMCLVGAEKLAIVHPHNGYCILIPILVVIVEPALDII